MGDTTRCMCVRADVNVKVTVPIYCEYSLLFSNHSAVKWKRIRHLMRRYQTPMKGYSAKNMATVQLLKLKHKVVASATDKRRMTRISREFLDCPNPSKNRLWPSIVPSEYKITDMSPGPHSQRQRHCPGLENVLYQRILT